MIVPPTTALVTHLLANHASETLASERSLLFITDLDGTIKGGEHEGSFIEYWKKEEAPFGSILCYNTARSIQSYRKLIHDLPQLPIPDVVITGEGTEIRWCVDKSKPLFKLDQIWDQKMRKVWRDSGLELRVRSVLRRHDAGVIQGLNDRKNSPPLGEYRFAITVQCGLGPAEALASELNEELGGDVYVYAFEGWGPEKPEIIVAIPRMAQKAHAALYVQSTLAISPQSCVAAGDTKGDSSMLWSGLPFIGVANSSSALLEDMADAGRPDIHILAEQPYALGVVEGLKYFRNKL